MENKKSIIEIEGFKEFEHKEYFPHLEIKDNIEAFVLRTRDGEEMSLIVDLNKRLLYTVFGSIKRDDGTEWKF
ncbi:hypothetical protein [Fusobacterium varium]|uniref:hypothetical protein n=1 Tax=Fusobacterium varium TaxID=856 RepID=UPI00241DE832|nr:hypothetical protein [Fusobacterium varium]